MARNPATGLTDKQQRFCEEYLRDFNATAAYLRAGYSGNTTTARQNGSKLLTNTNIQAYLSTLRQRVGDRAEVTLERTMQEIARLAFSDITTALTFDENGVKFKSSTQLPKDVRAAIASVSSTETAREFRGETEIKVTYSMKMHNKVAALNLLADFFGIRDDFNKARATLKRYGLALVEDLGSELGWRLERYAGDGSDSAAVEADRAAEEFFNPEEPETEEDI